MKKQHLSFALIGAVAIFASSCSCTTIREATPEVQQAFIQPPFGDVNVPFKQFALEAAEGGTFSYETGSRLHVPANAFLDDSGKVVQGKVDLHYREFTNQAEILVSGIPMAVAPDSNQYLESAGMMEIEAFQNGQRLFPNQNSPIQIDMASMFEADNYNLYELDTNQRSWIEKRKNLPVNRPQASASEFKEPNYDKLAANAGILKPITPRKADPKRYKFKYKIDLSEFPEMNIYDGIEWEYAGKRKSENPEKNPWVLRAFWYEMDLDKTKREGIYKLTLKTQDKTFVTTVRPVFDAADMDYALDVFEDKVANYRSFVGKKKAATRKWKQEQERKQRIAASNAKIYRTFEVQSFGIYNCDRFYQQENLFAINASFQDRNRKELIVSRAFLIDAQANTVLPFDSASLKALKFDPNRSYRMLVMDTSSTLFSYGPQLFSGFRSNRKSATFVAKSNGKSVESIEDVAQLLKRS